MQRARLRRRVDATIDQRFDQGLVRFGWRLSGIAAAVLLTGSAWLAWAAQPAAAANVTPVAAVTLPPWVAAGVAAGADPVAQPQPATPAAAWYLADATPRE